MHLFSRSRRVAAQYHHSAAVLWMLVAILIVATFNLAVIINCSAFLRLFIHVEFFLVTIIQLFQVMLVMLLILLLLGSILRFVCSLLRCFAVVIAMVMVASYSSVVVERSSHSLLRATAE